MRRVRTSHPSVSDLVAWVTGDDDASIAAHVASCVRCRRIADDWRALGVELRQGWEAEADAAFAPERLARQRDEVMRRVRRAGARVLRFPAPPGSVGRPTRVFGADIRRWVAAAALVGLVVGTLAGRFLLEPQGTAAVDSRLRPAVAPQETPTLPMLTGRPITDEAFLVELDAAVHSSSPRALRALDALTPGYEQ